jgi:hypothetical protein
MMAIGVLRHSEKCLGISGNKNMRFIIRGWFYVLCFSGLSACVTNSGYDVNTAHIQKKNAQLTSTAPAIDVSGLRSNLIQSGLDPYSPNGRTLLSEMEKFAGDPALSWAFSTPGQKQPVNWMDPENFTPAERVQLLKQFAGLGAASGSCSLQSLSHRDLVTLAKTMSPDAFRRLIGLIEFVMTHRNGASLSGEHYSAGQVINAVVALNSLRLLKPGASQQEQCSWLSSGVEAVSRMPEADQAIVTYEIFNRMNGKISANETVLRAPESYFDEEFDDRALPESVRNQLPPDGSHPLPFSKLVINAEWVREGKKHGVERVNDIYVNRYNNGVLSELTVPVVSDGKAGWAGFSSNFGYVTLRSQNINRSGATAQANVSGIDWWHAAARPIVPGSEIDYPLPQPRADMDAKTERCHVGARQSAKEFFPTLEGVAINMDCTITSSTGRVTSTHGVWLEKYGLALDLSSLDESGKSNYVIHGITIQ